MIQFKDSNGHISKIDNPPAKGVERASAVSKNKLTEDAATEGICGSITELDNKISSLKKKLDTLKTAASGLSKASCGESGCTVSSALSTFAKAETAAIENEIEVLEYMRTLFNFMKPDNMTFKVGE